MRRLKTNKQDSRLIIFLDFIPQLIQQFRSFDTNVCKTTAVQFSYYIVVFLVNHRVTWLLLSFWNLFNEDPGHCRPACVRVSILVASVATSNPESHSHLSLVDVIAVTFNMAVTVKIVVFAVCHVERTANGARSAALSAIKGEIPTTTAVVT